MCEGRAETWNLWISGEVFRGVVCPPHAFACWMLGRHLDILERRKDGGGSLWGSCCDLRPWLITRQTGGCFRAKMTFPPNYPLYPPKMKFETPIFHPNGKSRPTGTCSTIRLSNKLAVYESGDVCISILHPPGDDPNHYEQASERWSPIQSVEKILISVMSMIAEPNDESPANVDAARMWREMRPEFESRVKADVRKSLGL